MDAELNRDIKRAINVEVNRAKEHTLSGAKGYDRNDH
jgi:hypothetical protein